MKQEPELLVQPCDCGQPGCQKIVIAMRHPQIKTVEGTDELLSVVYLPPDQIQGMIDYIRDLARERGLQIR